MRHAEGYHNSLFDEKRVHEAVNIRDPELTPLGNCQVADLRKEVLNFLSSRSYSILFCVENRSEYLNAQCTKQLLYFSNNYNFSSTVVCVIFFYFKMLKLLLDRASCFSPRKTYVTHFKVDALISSGVKIEKIVVSPMTRTLQTAWGTFNGYNIPFQVKQNINEWTSILSLWFKELLYLRIYHDSSKGGI